MGMRLRRDGDETPSQVVRLATEQRTRTELLRHFGGLEALLSSDPDPVIAPELVSEIEPFLSMHDATCYRVAPERSSRWRAW
jgi:hypothetical protein